MVSNTFPINLIGELVAVRPNPPESGVLLPDWKRSLNGKILAVGPDVTGVVLGDTVYFGAAVGMDSIFNGQEIRIMKEKDLDFVYEDCGIKGCTLEIGHKGFCNNGL